MAQYRDYSLDYSGISEWINPLQLICPETEFKSESKFKPLPVIWQSLMKAIPGDNQRFLTADLMAKLLGQHSSSAWAGKKGKQNCAK